MEGLGYNLLSVYCNNINFLSGYLHSFSMSESQLSPIFDYFLIESLGSSLLGVAVGFE